MDKFYSDISPAIQKLSEIFCVSVEHLQEHLAEYVMEYGKFALANELSRFGVLGILLGVMCGLGTYSVIKEYYVRKTKPIVCAVLVGILVVIIAMLVVAFPYIVSPEMYSIKAVMQLIG